MYLSAIDEMNKNGIFQWDSVYPNKKLIETDIKKGQMYVGRSGNELVSAYVINVDCDVEYKNGNWKYPDAPYKIVHRLCVNPVFQNKGIAGQTMLHIQDTLKQQGIGVIRLDAFTKNPYALRLYEKLGYEKVGFAEWRMGKFYLLEKKI